MPTPIQTINRSLAFTAVLFLSCAVTPYEKEQSLMNANLRLVNTKLKAFSASKDIGCLEDSLPLVDNIHELDASGKVDPQIRREKTKAYLQVLKQVELSIDPHFNPEDGPTINVSPPRETQLPAGVDPKAIKDGKLRRQYEAAIEENKTKADYGNLQIFLRRFQNELQIQILAYVDSAYSRAPEDGAEVTRLLDSVGISERFKETIRSKLNAP